MDTIEKIKNQMEFYFSDSNYPKDKFLRAQAALNEEEYIPLLVFLTFARIKALTEDVEKIKEAVQSSENIKVSHDGKMVKRIAPLPEEDTSNQRTIYAKGFPLPAYTMEDVRSVFDKYGKILCVRLRRKADKAQKPSCFVEFSTKEEAQAAVVAKNTFQGNELIVMMKADFFAKKKEERKKQLEAKKNKRKADAPAEEEAKGGKEAPNKKSKRGGEKETKKDDDIKISRCVVAVKNIGENMNRDYIKEAFSEYGTVLFVDYSDKQEDLSSGYVRFSDAETAQKAVTQATAAKKEIGGKVVDVAVLTEDEEKQYWKNVSEAKNKPKGGKGKKGRRKRF